MKLSDLTLDLIRNTYTIEYKEELETITVYNLFGEEKQSIKDMINKDLDTGLEGVDLIESVYTETFKLATDLEVDVPLIDAMENPSKELTMIMHEVLDIVKEIIMEVLYERHNLIIQLQPVMLAKKTLLESEKLEILNGECERLEKEIEELKKGD